MAQGAGELKDARQYGPGSDHGFKGILGAERAKLYTPSGYNRGDQGGSASGYGLPHGIGGGAAGGGAMGGMGPMHGLGIPALGFEGGDRGGGVSETETLPAQYSVKKTGYDEHRQAGSHPGGTVHGEPGAEGIKDHPCGVGGCGFTAKSPHGLARHAMARHGKTEVGHALRSHACSYDDKEPRGNVDDLKSAHKVAKEFEAATSKIDGVGLVHDTASSYGAGDKDGSYGRGHGYSYPY